MADGWPRLYCDDRGVWRDDQAGHSFGITWEEIISVGGYKLDAYTTVYTIVELDYPNGHFFELYADWPGFTEVSRAITVRLPGIHADWQAELASLQPQAPPLMLWRRDESGGPT